MDTGNLTSEEPTIRASYRVKNNCLMERREALGLTLKGLSERSGVNYSTCVAFETMKASPILKSTNDWSDNAWRIAFVFEVTPEELWPHEVLEHGIRTSGEMDMDLAGVDAITGITWRRLAENPSDSSDLRILRGELNAVLDALPPREGAFIRRHIIDGETLEEIADDAKLSRDRVRQIVNKGLSRTRHPGERRRRLQEFLPEGDDYFFWEYSWRKERREDAAKSRKKRREMEEALSPEHREARDRALSFRAQMIRDEKEQAKWDKLAREFWAVTGIRAAVLRWRKDHPQASSYWSDRDICRMLHDGALETGTSELY
jgi:RNA polymerase sigma factor (sigma-70 family)